MKKRRLNTSFRRYSDANLQTKTQVVIKGHTDNPHFTTPTPYMEEVSAALLDFNIAITAAANGDRYKISERNEARKKLVNLLERLAGYDMMISGGNATILASGGFDLEKEDRSREVVPPKTIKLTSGPGAGEVIVKVSGAKAVKVYYFEYTEDPQTDRSEWVTRLDTKGKHLLKELQSSKKYHIRVSVIGKGGVKIAGPVASIVVQ